MTQSYAALDERYLHPMTDPADRGRLTVLVRGRGIRLEDAEGRSYIDGLAGLWNVNLGHGREELVEAAADQMRRLAFANTYSGFANAPALELAARLESVAYPGLKASFLATSGVDANEAAFKTARYFWRRQGRPSKVKVISLEHGYHGATIAGMSATGIPDYAKMFGPRLAEFLHVRSHYPYRCDFARPGEGPGAAAARLLEEAIVREGPETVAAFLVEPVQGAGGVIVPPADYFPRVREILDRHDVLLIADEIITGFCRTGLWFGLSHWHVTPDILSFAKGVTSGYLPLGGFMVTRAIKEVMDSVRPEERWMHAFTNSGHPVCCAVAVKNIEIMERERLWENSAEMGARLHAGLTAAFGDHPNVGEIRAGKGLLAAVEFVEDWATKRNFPSSLKFAAKLKAELMARGVFTRTRPAVGPHPSPGDILFFAPPLVINEKEIDRLVSVSHDALMAVLETL